MRRTLISYAADEQSTGGEERATPRLSPVETLGSPTLCCGGAGFSSFYIPSEHVVGLPVAALRCPSPAAFTPLASLCVSLPLLLFLRRLLGVSPIATCSASLPLAHLRRFVRCGGDALVLLCVGPWLSTICSLLTLHKSQQRESIPSCGMQKLQSEPSSSHTRRPSPFLFFD